MNESAGNALPIVFGEALVDVFADTLVPGGAPFNVACHLAALGARPLLITRFGDDAAGRMLRDTADRCGLSLRGAQVNRATATVKVTERPDGHVFDIGSNQAFDRIDAQAAARVSAASPGPCWLYFGTLALRDQASRDALAAVRRERAHRAYVDLNWRKSGPPPEIVLPLLRHVEVLKVSDDELGRLLDWLGLAPIGQAPLQDEYSEAIAGVAVELCLRHLLVSHGADGASAWDPQGRCIARAPAPPLDRLVDAVGAGDAFSAMMLAGLLRGRPAGAMLGQAVAFASRSCSWRGALPEQVEVYQLWRDLLDDAPASRRSRA